MKETEKALLEFPTVFPIKIIGNNTGTFQKEAVDAIRSVLNHLDESAVKIEYSKNKKYISLTASVLVNSQGQLDSVYRALTSLKDAKFVL